MFSVLFKIFTLDISTLIYQVPINIFNEKKNHTYKNIVHIFKMKHTQITLFQVSDRLDEEKENPRQINRSIFYTVPFSQFECRQLNLPVKFISTSFIFCRNCCGGSCCGKLVCWIQGEGRYEACLKK